MAENDARGCLVKFTGVFQQGSFRCHRCGKSSEYIKDGAFRCEEDGIEFCLRCCRKTLGPKQNLYRGTFEMATEQKFAAPPPRKARRSRDNKEEKEEKKVEDLKKIEPPEVSSAFELWAPSKDNTIELSENNTKMTSLKERGWSTLYGATSIKSGKCRWDVKIVKNQAKDNKWSILVGVGCDTDLTDLYFTDSRKGYAFAVSSGEKVHSEHSHDFLGHGIEDGDVVNVILDLDEKALFFGINGKIINDEPAFRNLPEVVYHLAVTCSRKGNEVAIINESLDGDFDAWMPTVLAELSDYSRTLTSTRDRKWVSVFGIKSVSDGKCEWKIKIVKNADKKTKWSILLGVGYDTSKDSIYFTDDRRGYALAPSTGQKVYGETTEDFGAPIEDDDEITVILDLEEWTLSFLRNGEPMGDDGGVAYENLPAMSYRLAVSFCREGNIVTLC